MSGAVPSHDLRRRFAENLRRARKRANVSQEELSFRASLHRTEVGQLERGQRLARIDTLIKLAGSLSIPPGDLLDGMVWTPGFTEAGTFRGAAEQAQADAATED